MLHFFRRIGAFFRSLWAELTQNHMANDPAMEQIIKLSKKLSPGDLNKFSTLYSKLASELTELKDFNTIANFLAIIFNEASYENTLEKVAGIMARELNLIVKNSKEEKLELRDIIKSLINKAFHEKLLVRAFLLSIIPDLDNRTAAKIREIQKQEPAQTFANNPLETCCSAKNFIIAKVTDKLTKAEKKIRGIHKLPKGSRDSLKTAAEILAGINIRKDTSQNGSNSATNSPRMRR